MKTQRVCYLEKIRRGEKCLINKGDELELVTKSGKSYQGIVFDFNQGHIHTVVQFGILILFPIHSLVNIYQL
jgi:hypothetical protein